MLNFRGNEDLSKLGKEYLNDLLCKFDPFCWQHSKTFDVLHVFLWVTIAELSTLKQVRFFWSTLYVYLHARWIGVTCCQHCRTLSRKRHVCAFCCRIYFIVYFFRVKCSCVSEVSSNWLSDWLWCRRSTAWWERQTVRVQSTQFWHQKSETIRHHWSGWSFKSKSHNFK